MKKEIIDDLLPAHSHKSKAESKLDPYLIGWTKVPFKQAIMSLSFIFLFSFSPTNCSALNRLSLALEPRLSVQLQIYHRSWRFNDKVDRNHPCKSNLPVGTRVLCVNLCAVCSQTLLLVRVATYKMAHESGGSF